MMNNFLITILGPTAIGKTNLSITLAKHFNTEIISCDSRQFFKEMTIGTAVPTKEELAEVPHHFIQNLSIFDTYNVGQFENDAIILLDKLFKKHRVLVLVGGSGLYVDAVLTGLDVFPEIDPSIRKRLQEKLNTYGISSLQSDLKELDKQTYDSLDLSNQQRLIRALEVCIGTGKPFASFLNKKKNNRNFTPIKIGLKADRTIIYERINGRVDEMITAGLVGEAKELHPNKELNALQTVGYKELFRYFDQECSLEFATDEIKKNSRRFAKRQLTWFRKDLEISWFDFKEKPINFITHIEKYMTASKQ